MVFFILKKVFQFSFANTLESLAAARVSIKAIGVKTMQGIHMPKKGLITWESARFSPVVIIEKYNIPEGKELGNKLKMIEEFWTDNNFQISENEVKKILNN